MSSATYGSKHLSSAVTGRSPSLQRPFQIVIMAGDFLLVLLSYVCASLAHRELMGIPADHELSVGAGLIVAMLFVTIAFGQGGYDRHNLLNARWQSRQVLLVWILSLTILAVAAFLLKSTTALSRATIILFAAMGLISLGAHRAVWRLVLTSSFARGHSFKRRVVLLSQSPLDFTSSRFKDLRKNGFEVVHHVVLNLTPQHDDAAWDRDVLQIVRESRAAEADEFLLAFNWNELPTLQKLSQRLRQVPNAIRLLPDFAIADLVSRPFVPISGTMAIELQRAPPSIAERALKRGLDVSLASLGLLCMAPLLIITAILIKLDSPGSVIFRQTRRGINGGLFDIWKFRSMTVSDNGPEIRQASKRDARVTRIGRLLRKTSIDELPQLWNVLRGEMSLVGPRPHALAHDNYYNQMISNYAYRHHVKPGLTGWAQVNGFRGETPTIDLMKKRVEYDVWYVTNWSIWLDLRILMRTAIVLSSQDAY
ncbi:undecaprenyl-phosphate glucose phosphotransferase [Bradyrhizobium hipponense]|uniref:Undecaprenyl-phosphate glucose phosphotransferase n=1 Tax=Bradyrhizobium hipponense TaxID=2605638 RepID=A0A5S4YK04_9BRAD|nr:undecaprenyl-phosphate glucose phosphotransferase [Bradyrhizobium hipponense]TYO63944.1 undecaprenyl-phosphate glucose phosphotransferase [Bradyrhizobium hipponense]